MKIKISDEIASKAPGLHLIVGTATIKNGPTQDALWTEIEQVAERMRDSYEMPMINKRPAIAATRAAYKACGKDPNRYRPSTESLCRRMVKGLDLYRSLSVIDLINLASVASGHSIGGFDLDKVEGDTLTLGIGREGEPYEGIGRGPLNIAGLPVLRDAVGGIGTPTSDNERTKLEEGTRRLLLVINAYGTEMADEDVVALFTRLLTQYADAKDINFTICNSSETTEIA